MKTVSELKQQLISWWQKRSDEAFVEDCRLRYKDGDRFTSEELARLSAIHKTTGRSLLGRSCS